jgi:autotransporter-associated beta strand protein
MRMNSGLCQRLIAALALGLTVMTASAATRVWNGNVSGNWSTAGNWAGATAPVAGDTLEFPAGATRFTTTNNYPVNTEFNVVVISGAGYSFHGNALRLRGDNGVGQALFFTMPNGNCTWRPDITLSGTNSSIYFVTANTGQGTVLIEGDVALGTHDLSLQVEAHDLELRGAISGSANSSVSMSGGGTVTFSGAIPNTYGNGTFVSDAELVLNKTALNGAVPEDLVVFGNGHVTWLRGQQIADNGRVSFTASAGDLDGFNEVIANLDLYASSILDLGGAVLTLSSGITGSGGAITGGGRLQLTVADHEFNISGQPSLLNIQVEVAGLASITKSGIGQLVLSASNTFTGTLRVEDGMVRLQHDLALGNTAGETVLNSGTLELAGTRRILGETLIIEETTNGVSRLSSGCTSNVWSGPIEANGNLFIHTCQQGPPATPYSLTLSGVLSGAGNVRVEGEGALLLTGNAANTHSGFFMVAEGLVVFDKPNTVSATTGSIYVGDTSNDHGPATLRLASSQQIADSAAVWVGTNATFQLTNFNETVGPLTMAGGRIQTGAGTLTLSDDVAVTGSIVNSSQITGRLNVGSGAREIQSFGNAALYLDAHVFGSANLSFDGPGYLILRGSNAFTGTLTILDGSVEAQNDHALGSTAGGTIVNGGGLSLGDGIIGPGPGIHIGNEPLSLGTPDNVFAPLHAVSASGDSWAGPIDFATNTLIRVAPPGSLVLSGALSGPGRVRLEGGEEFTISGSQPNTFTGEIQIPDGTLRLAKTGGAVAVPNELRIGGTSPFDNAVVESLGQNQIADGATVVMHENGRWNLNGFNETIGNLFGALASDSGEIALGGATLTVLLTNSFGSFPGTITGPGGFTKQGTGTFELSGDNTYTGSTLVQNGTLRVAGSQPASAVTVLTGATLGGGGTVGPVQVNAGGTVWPGHAFFGPLTTSNATLNTGATFKSRLLGNGLAESMNVRGAVALNEATLALELLYLPAPGDSFILIQNDGADAVTGIFAGIPSGTFTGPGGLAWEIGYSDDVTLKLASQGISAVPGGSNYADVVVVGGNGNGVIDPNECAGLRIPMFNDTAVLRPEFTVHLSSPVPGVIFQQAVSAYPAIPPGGFAFNITPFQLSTPTNLPCGTNIHVTAVITAGTNAPFVIELLLPTGKPAAEQTVASVDVPEPIGDAGAITNTIAVESFSGALAGVEVSLNIPHELVSDLDITLVAPNGAAITLASAMGNGADYGTGCTGAQRTRFSMGATQFIGNAAAPFVGTFRPVGNLNLLRGLSGDEVVGKWHLRLADRNRFNVGSLACWSLHLFAAECEDGGGQCERCPGSIAGDISRLDPVANGLAYDPSGTNTFCFSQDVAPELFSAGNHAFDRHTFTNYSASPACVNVSVGGACTNAQLWAAAYIGGFNPTNVLENFAGSLGEMPSAQKPFTGFSFTVPANAHFEVIVFEYQSLEGCEQYTLNVDGTDLCRPRLDIIALSTNTMRLDWPTYATGYSLERTPALPANNWSTVTNEPVILKGRYVVTNEVLDATGLYRLHKP